MRALTPIALPLPRWRANSLHVSAVALGVGALTLLALTVRLVWVFYTDTMPLGGDPHWYFVVGSNIANGYGFVAQPHSIFGEVPGPGEATAFWPPGYPIALAGLFKLTGVSMTSPQVMNTALGALTVPLVFALGRSLFDQRAGLFAAGLFAIYPNVIAGVPLLFPEPMFTLVFVAALWLITLRPAERSWLPIAAFGVLVGVACLTRGQGLVLLPVATCYWLARDGWRGAVRPTAIATLAAVLLIAPWTIRNAIQMQAFIPISTNSGAALRVGHGPESIGTTLWTSDEVNGLDMEHAMNNPDTEVEAYRTYTGLAIDYAFTHPLRELELTKLKLWNLYRSDAEIVPWITTLGTTPLDPGGLDETLWKLLDVTYYVMFLAAVASMPLWLRRSPEAVMLAAVFVFWTLFHVAFLAEPRYHVPLYPFFMIAVAGGAWMAIDWMKDTVWRRSSRSAPQSADA
jgi:4-amino-4-deoxy-L-arabinose transferase-like glycosyltransferase